MSRFSLFSNSYQYFNGNYIVRGESRNKFFKIEKRSLRVDEDFKSDFPDSIDLKITDKCSHGCPFCHESSTPAGKTFDLERTKHILEQLPRKQIEIAIGGGNVLECLPELNDLCEWLRSRTHRPRITLNVRDLMGDIEDPKNKEICEVISKNIEGVGVSLSSLDFLKEAPKPKAKKKDDFWGSRRKLRLLDKFPMGYKIGQECIVVYHIIAGIFPISELDQLVKSISDECILVLGYKQWGRAKNDKLPDLGPWRNKIKEILGRKETDLGSIGFDNLACEQLDLQNLIPGEVWNKIYLGDEGSCSMYIDAVRGEFARTSRSPERESWNNIGLLDYYASLHK